MVLQTFLCSISTNREIFAIVGKGAMCDNTPCDAALRLTKTMHTMIIWRHAAATQGCAAKAAVAAVAALCQQASCMLCQFVSTEFPLMQAPAI